MKYMFHQDLVYHYHGLTVKLLQFHLLCVVYCEFKTEKKSSKTLPNSQKKFKFSLYRLSKMIFKFCCSKRPSK
jgi:hypothetical protein